MAVNFETQAHIAELMLIATRQLGTYPDFIPVVTLEEFPDMIRQSMAGAAKRMLSEGLSRYDSSVLDRLKELGVKYTIYDHKNPPPGGFPKPAILSTGDKWEDNKAAYYAREDKTVCLRQDSFEDKRKDDTLNTITHETAHAVDDLLESDRPHEGSPVADMMSFKDETLKKLYESYNERCDNYAKESMGGFFGGTGGVQGGKGTGEQVKNPQWSDYARTNESEYFAEGMMKFTAGGEAREGFKKADPGLYDFVEKKMGQAQGPLPEYKEPPLPPPLSPEQSKKFRETYSLPSEVSGALFTGNLEETKKIISEFPDYLKQGSFGAIHPLHAAAFGDKPKEMLTFLAGQGLDINAKVTGDKTVLDIAREAGRREVVEILQSLGAKDK